MTRTFVETPQFTTKWHSLGLNDDDLRELQQVLLKKPKAGSPINGVPGLRKIRVACNGHGKRGGARVIYVDVEIREKIHLINVYPKNEKDDLTSAEKKALSVVVRFLKEE